MWSLSVAADKSLDIRSHCGAEYLTVSQMSLPLLRLLSEIVTVIGMICFYLTGARNGEPFGGSLVCLDLSHFFVSFRFRKLLIPYRPVRKSVSADRAQALCVTSAFLEYELQLRISGAHFASGGTCGDCTPNYLADCLSEPDGAMNMVSCLPSNTGFLSTAPYSEQAAANRFSTSRPSSW